MNDLTKLYNELNEQLFDGKLPARPVVYSKLPPGKLGQYYSERGKIEISHLVTNDQLRRILLHEMCHIGCPYHGEKFMSKLARLVDRGEWWAV